MKKLNSVTKITFLIVLVATVIHCMYFPSIRASVQEYANESEVQNQSSLYTEINDSAYEKAFDLYYQVKLKGAETTSLVNLYLKDADKIDDVTKESISSTISNNILRGNNLNIENNILYYVIDNDTEETIYNTGGALTRKTLDVTELQENYEWYLVIDFNENGVPSVNYDFSSNTDSISTQTYYNAFNYVFSGIGNIKTNNNVTSFTIDNNIYEYVPIKNTTFRFALNNTTSLSPTLYISPSYYPDNTILEMIVTFGFFVAIVSLGLIFSFKNQMLLGFQTNKDEKDAEVILVFNDKTYPASLRNIPIEIMVIIDLFVLGICTNLGDIVYSTVYAFCVLFLIYLFTAYNVWYYVLLIKEKSLLKHSICAYLWSHIKNPVQKAYVYTIHLDMTNQDTRRLVTIASINFVILLLISGFNDFETKFTLLILYTVALYFLLRNYIKSINKDYHRLLNVIRNIAIGKTNNHIDENLGLFEPFKPELKDIQTNIETAIAEEVHSQQMKTELITNVSHDLKTPLTSLISYIDLLKKKDLPQKDRDKYLDIIDKSSLRLKHLVEDLFEVSKANSGNISLDLMKMDIIALLKQVEVECDDALKKQKLTIRNTFSDDKVILSLDSQKTYRIFENLISNISKYALKGTRVYVDVKDYDTFVEISMKNISAQELNFDVDDITERFMRGDKSRNTEGSGLGLAIVKSFTELQNGTLKIQTDGDLFKVFIRFPKESNQDFEKTE